MIIIIITFLNFIYLGLPSCDHTQFHCALSKKCIPREWICDGELDCGMPLNSNFTEQDVSDEDPMQCNIFRNILQKHIFVA